MDGIARMCEYFIFHVQRRRVLVENKLCASDDEQQSLLQLCERRQNCV